MSHQTGITAGKELLEYFATCKEGHVRLIKIGIVNEELVLQDSKDVDGTWEDDILCHICTNVQLEKSTTNFQ
ncbi:twinfilin [Mytilus galloprovincialis]|uniref:Twinfilin n=1 Tax=Mytilus galloprovincialis TaxID=29158 RepID=A0A8B6FGA4_MYTGA|nr:twinfilin [Mytilus galloprovincialis]